MHVLLAASWLDPFTHLVASIIGAIDGVVGNRGWSLVLFALLLKIVVWPLNTKQFTAMIKMQRLAPQLKNIQQGYKQKEEQAKRKGDDGQVRDLQAQMQRETMELYRKNGANPLAGCWPMLVQWPFIAAVYYAVTLKDYRPLYQGQHWLWIGTPFTQHLPVVPIWKAPLLASSLTMPDIVLLIGYMISMYLFSRYATMPSTDPQQAQTQKLMAIFSPVMLGYMGFQFKWPSAMVLYWFSYNVFTMGQQFYLLKKHHQPLSMLDNEHAITDIPDQPKPAAKALGGNGAVAKAAQPASSPKSRSKKRKGAKR